jgi:predicted outer membrane protein
MFRTSLIAIAYGAASLMYSQSADKSSDGKFLKDAAEGNMAEIEMGRLALKSSSNDLVKQSRSA